MQCCNTIHHGIIVALLRVYVTIFVTHQQMWVTDENNRRIIDMLGRIIGEIFKNCRIDLIMGKIKSILGSGLMVDLISG